MKRTLYNTAVLLLLAALIVVVALVGWPTYYNHAETASLAAFTQHSREITAVEVLRLSDTADSGPAGSYRVRIDGSRRGIVSRQTLTGSQASDLVHVWGSVRLSSDYRALCHEPGFVLRFLAGQRCLFEVAVCLMCENASWQSSPFTASVRGMIPTSFDKNSGTDALKKFLTQLP